MGSRFSFNGLVFRHFKLQGLRGERFSEFVVV